MAKKHVQLSRFGVYAVLKYKSKYVLIKKSKGPFKGRWDLPGGKVDFGETPEDALERELMEETGLKPRDTKLIDAIGYERETENEILHHVGIIYDCETRNIKKLKREPDGNDSFGAEVFTRKELKELKLTPLAKIVFKKY
ncbi:MAG: NUDIX domain-containing protein [Ignavibacteria bacterium]|nr:NUDIX domain-containing protein [Ignavibacteria bacterium]